MFGRIPKNAASALLYCVLPRSPAAFYWRNCTANGDRKPGDKTDYCAKGDSKVEGGGLQLVTLE